ncbi:5'-methylthioadenosine/S-adenosylhomocysteine nucleosidase [Sediminibacillus albus]|uniref:5'-methylthioadenosine/S-adenosylhomocysteine nucleosidase n=1 Tax=Sediminibacillus albus TaxID=407036 RepID=A0A1G9CLW8_9BACI|nr:5'-methylthioadenosine/S-adenosylhomocysteine nucleosidase [Sediminibacillus albus]SDK52475.1 adenosylhomocysteine nucleosidase [Sediminibacillus albus]
MTIAIIGAMDEEVELIKSKMDIKKTVEIAGSSFVEGTLNHRDVVLLQSGIGKVNAAMSATILHERYKPACVINTGSAGGFDRELEVGDLVISTDVVHHDADVTAFNYEYGQVPGMPAKFAADKKLVELAAQAASGLNGIHAKTGLIATGDSFMQDTQRVNFVRDKFPNMLAAEMEAAAIAQVSYKYDVPFVVIRALSDIAGKDSSVSFEEFLEKAAANAANLIMDIVENI